MVATTFPSLIVKQSNIADASGGGDVFGFKKKSHLPDYRLVLGCSSECQIHSRFKATHDKLCLA